MIWFRVRGRKLLTFAGSELADILPASRDARLDEGDGGQGSHGDIFASSPAWTVSRPAQKSSASENLYLAGDWTRTGWPSTMEGAVRSGYLAAEAVLAEFRAAANIFAAGPPVRGSFEIMGEAK